MPVPTIDVYDSDFNQIELGGDRIFFRFPHEPLLRPLPQRKCRRSCRQCRIDRIMEPAVVLLARAAYFCGTSLVEVRFIKTRS